MITATHKGKYYDVEYSIVNVSELEGELRIDAEYYDPFWIRNIINPIKNKKWSVLDSFLKMLYRYPTFYNINYKTSGVLVLKGEDIPELGFIENKSGDYIDEETNKKFRKTILKQRDLVMSVRGLVGKVGYITPDLEGSNINANMIRISLDNTKIMPEYVWIFLVSKYGQMQIKRVLMKTNQETIVSLDIKNLKIPIPSDIFQKFIEKLVLKAYEERKKAEQLYKQAEEILLEELGLKNWKPKTKKIKIGGREFEEEENISIRMLSEVIKADRMDAEYWEPKYDEIENIIKNYERGYSTVGNEFLHRIDKMQINKDEFYNYVEISSVNTSIGDFKPSYIKGKELPANAKLKLEKNDLIVSKVRTYRKGIALIHKIYPNLVGSSAFVVLHEKDEKENKQINIETLFVFLRTNIFSQWSYKFYTGTSYPTLTDDDILNLPIPKVEQQTQQKISQLIQQSFKARENSRKLLEIAKRTVEIYIEKDEKEGLNYARNKLNKLNELNIEIN